MVRQPCATTPHRTTTATGHEQRLQRGACAIKCAFTKSRGMTNKLATTKSSRATIRAIWRNGMPIRFAGSHQRGDPEKYAPETGARRDECGAA